MSQTSHSDEAQPVVRASKRFSRAWFIPILAIISGVFLVKQTIDEQGELIHVTFENAKGLSADKTEIQCRNIQIGTIESLRLTKDLKVAAKLRIKPDHMHLIRSDSKFWVVRARVTGTSVSGLSTLVSGAYIELDPGQGEPGKDNFIGENNPPPTPSSIPGLRIALNTSSAGSISVGTGVYFKDNEVGKVESRVFDPASQSVTLGIFIEEQFQELVVANTQFWKSSGFRLKLGTEGLNLDLPSLSSLLNGRIEFGFPGGIEPAGPLLGKAQFTLHEDLAAAEDANFESAAEFLLLLDQSARGLSIGSPLEFRGIQVGRVKDISYELTPNINIRQTPILCQINGKLLAKHFPKSLRDDENGFQTAIQDGLRASIKSGNLITSQLYIDLDFYPDAPANELTQIGDYLILPTTDTGLQRLEESVTNFLKKMDELPLEELFAGLTKTSQEASLALSEIRTTFSTSTGLVPELQNTLQQLTATLENLETFTGNENTQALPDDIRSTLAQINQSLEPLSNEGAVYGDLRRTLDELRGTLQSVQRASSEISDNPNSLIFGKTPKSKLKPKARK